MTKGRASSDERTAALAPSEIRENRSTLLFHTFMKRADGPRDEIRKSRERESDVRGARRIGKVHGDTWPMTGAKSGKADRDLMGNFA